MNTKNGSIIDCRRPMILRFTKNPLKKCSSEEQKHQNHWKIHFLKIESPHFLFSAQNWKIFDEKIEMEEEIWWASLSREQRIQVTAVFDEVTEYCKYLQKDLFFSPVSRALLYFGMKSLPTYAVEEGSQSTKLLLVLTSTDFVKIYIWSIYYRDTDHVNKVACDYCDTHARASKKNMSSWHVIYTLLRFYV